MPISEILFGFKGRVARLPYFGYSLLVLVPVSVIVAAALVSLASNAAVGVVLFAVAGIIGLWTGLALTIKRLHDMGMSGTHAIWIFGVGIVAGAVSTASEAFGILLNLISLGTFLWLVFGPGQSQANQYGPGPGGQPTNEISAVGRM